MRIHVVNPNTTSPSMTEKILGPRTAKASRASRSPRPIPRIRGRASIEGYYDEAFSVPGLIDEIGKAANADAPSSSPVSTTPASRRRDARRRAPVVGVGEAAFHMASLIADEFSVVTTLSHSIAPIEHNLFRYGLAARVRAAEAPVLALEAPNSGARRLIEQEIERALAEGRCGSDRARLRRYDRPRTQPEREGGRPRARRRRLRRQPRRKSRRVGLRTSKRNAYAPPLAKAYAGEFKRFSPGKA